MQTDIKGRMGVGPFDSLFTLNDGKEQLVLL